MNRFIPIALGLFLVLGISSCRDRCKNLDCGTNGSCVEGECVCNSGYDGGLCEETVTEKFNRTYQLEESCTAGDDLYDVVMIPDADDPSLLYMIGVWEQDQDTLEARVEDDGTTISISRQPLGNVEVSGTGSGDVFGISVDINYEVYFSGQSSPFDICSASLSTP